MAKINKQEVIQKLIDELQLYPGKDMIPTELAEKILAVYQINTQDITVQTPSSNIVRSGQAVGAATAVTLYTTPATGKFYLSAACVMIIAHGGSDTDLAHVGLTIDGVAQKVLTVQVDDVNTQHNVISLSFPNPILVDPATNITLTNAAGGAGAISQANIIGYTV